MNKSKFISKHVAQKLKDKILSHKNETVFRISHIKNGQAVTRSTDITGAVVNLELRTAQTLICSLFASIRACLLVENNKFYCD
jgi:hypothetical protein